MALSDNLRPVSFASLPGWQKDETCLNAFRSFVRSAENGLVSRVKTGSLGIKAESFHPAFVAATHDPCRTEAEARAFFETFFRPYQLSPESSEDPLLTGYYQPVHNASRHRTERFRYPLYERPDDLVAVDGHHPDMPEGFAFARQTGNGLVPYFDRRAIEQGALSRKGLEIAWLESRIDAFFIHIQGSSLLRLPDGSDLRVGYAAKSGHAFNAIGRYLIDQGEIEKKRISMQEIRRWLENNPQRMDEVLWQNRSFIFFRTLDEPRHDGPEGASGVNLVAGRSIAVDSDRYTWGTPVFLDSPTRIVFADGATLPRLMIAQDTGSAIKGNCRADLFMGTGEKAGELAGHLKEPGTFHLLVPVAASERQ